MDLVIRNISTLCSEYPVDVVVTLVGDNFSGFMASKATDGDCIRVMMNPGTDRMLS